MCVPNSRNVACAYSLEPLIWLCAEDLLQSILVFVSPPVTALYRRYSTGPPAIAVKPLAEGVGRFIVKSWLVKINFVLCNV
jgi:hypothetical protein